jgi:RNA polymerase sigma-70 factor (sigma-E family)
MSVEERGARSVASDEAGPVEIGSDAALARVFEVNGPGLVGLARLLLDDRAQAEEIVQEAFVRTYAGWWRVRDQDDPLPYVRQTVVNLARGGLRKRRTRRSAVLERPAEVPSAEATADARRRDRAVDAAVRALPRRQRECVVFRYYLDCSLAETASALRISVGSVKQHVHRALGSLAGTLGEMDR